MAVKIRMKRLGRKHRSYFRICATDSRAPRDGRVIEELGSYDPEVPLTDARCKLNNDRVQYWLGVGEQRLRHPVPVAAVIAPAMHQQERRRVGLPQST